MRLTDHAAKWVGGEILQGKIMMLFGMIFIIACYLIWKSGGDFAKGMAMPMVPVIVLFIGYGGWLNIKRPQQLDELAKAYEKNPELTQTSEEKRALKEKQAYLKYKILWGIVLPAGLALLLLIPITYFKGVALGLLVFGVSALTVDTLLEKRIAAYYENIRIREENDQLHADKEFDFSITLSSEWEIVQDAVPVVKLSANSQIKTSNGMPEANIKVVAAELEKGISLEQYYENSILAYAAMWNVLNESTLEQRDPPNKKVELIQSVGPQRTKVMKLFLQSDKKIFVVSCSAGIETYEKYRQKFEDILQSFKVISK